MLSDDVLPMLSGIVLEELRQERLNFFRKRPYFLLTTYTNMLYMGTPCGSERRRPSSVHRGRVATVSRV